MLSTLLALCKEAENIKSRLKIPSIAWNQSITQKLDSIITQAERTLEQKAHTLHQALQAEKAFSVTHNLIDKSVTPNPVISLLLMGICLFIDAGVNSSFLYNAHMVSGPFAALLVSFLISLTNVVLAVGGGYYIGRFLNYGIRSTDVDTQEIKIVRGRAKWQFKVFIAVMAFFILTVGLVRSTESLDKIGHSLSHYHELIVTPEAVFLVLLNICIAVFSFHKGKTGFSHPYGDYSTYQQSVTAAHDDLHQFYQDYVEEIEDACADVEDDAQASVSAQAKEIKEYNKKVTECHQLSRELEEATRAAENEFLAAANRIVHTHSVLEGKDISVPEGLLNHFSFNDASGIELPEFYHASSRSENNPALAKAKAAALKRLSDVLKRHA
ncbi:hypothetical protein [Nitrosomonas sp. JL21]|uniref:hypothetical protein n=1 Tax=Nitrosomonas sp. JL21 TaxID=153949 RepID=UPI00136A5511|nr:hypothetical protein [Nitrosomonas sp. JL21]MBL8496787.1 hypothetical protein [Nitrosomonas sp.]MBL8498461.1 hypothetical protein [Nitrosomonas sp.]